jgi:adenine-specific DNA-methyltransferase
MRRAGTPLGELGFDAYTGTIVWNRLKEQVRDQASADALPLIWGNAIRPFRFQTLGNRFGQGTHMAVMDRTANIISRGDALLIKRMTAKEERRRIVACRVPDHLARSERGWFAENHVNVIRAVDAPISLDALLGLLNSRLFDYVFRAFNGSTQVSANELQTLPVVTGNRLAQIAYLASSLRTGAGADTQGRLDKLVYDLYEIDPADRAVINATFDR